MESYILWVIAAFILIIAELTTSTFYLLVFGVASLAGALAAYVGGEFFVQALLASVVSIGGIIFVNRWRKKHTHASHRANDMDIGQVVTFESWINPSARLAQVKYRDAIWEAFIDGDSPVQTGDVFYIHGKERNQLQISSSKLK